MDETPEELEQIRREADQIDIYRYRRRFRAMKAVALGALGAGVVWVVLWMVDSKKNPCERVRDHYCRIEAQGTNCKMYTGIHQESVSDDNAEMRGTIRAQCQSKIDRLKEEDGVTVK